MSRAIPNPESGLIAELKALRAELNVLKGTPAQSSFNQRFQAVRTKAGTPSDADYTAVTMPPVGAIVIDTTGSKIWVRTAVATWKSVLVA